MTPIVAMVTDLTSLVLEHGIQCMSCSANFLRTLQTEILSTETSDFLKQIHNYSLVIYFCVMSDFIQEAIFAKIITLIVFVCICGAMTQTNLS